MIPFLLAQATSAPSPTAANEWTAITAIVIAVVSMITTIATTLIKRGSTTKLGAVQKTVASHGTTLTDHGQKLSAHSDKLEEHEGMLNDQAKDIAAIAERAADTDPNIKPVLTRLETIERDVRVEQTARSERYKEQVAENLELAKTLTRFEEALKRITSQLENGNGNGRRRRAD